MQSYPSSAVYKILKKRNNSPLVIGLQHGLFQFWSIYNSNFCADYLFTFSNRHINELYPEFQKKSLAVGLPKLDSLQDFKIMQRGYVLYLAQRQPDPDIIIKLLDELEEFLGVPVFVRDHPQYPNLIKRSYSKTIYQDSYFLKQGLSYQNQLANANWILTPHST